MPEEEDEDEDKTVDESDDSTEEEKKTYDIREGSDYYSVYVGDTLDHKDVTCKVKKKVTAVNIIAAEFNKSDFETAAKTPSINFEYNITNEIQWKKTVG
jgi:hypothetical protein